jgi:phospholipid/cholesterol/gamma-HCH transport system substrate-binding protein
VGALRDSAIVNDALQGKAPRDLSRMVRGIARTSSGLARHEEQLRDLIVDFNSAMATMASRAPELSETVRLLGPTAANARRGFASIGRALPPTRAFAREILPGVRETRATTVAGMPWFTQAAAFFGPQELGGLLTDLGPATRHLARLGHGSRRLLPKSDHFNQCVNQVLLPTGNIRVEDGPLSAGVENHKEFWYAMVGQAGEGQGFDGNGSYLRLTAPGGAQTIQTGRTNLTGEPLFAKVVSPPLRTRPAFPGAPPPLRRDVPCHRNPVPDVNGPSSIGPPDGSRASAPLTPVPRPASASRLMPISSLGEGGR